MPVTFELKDRIVTLRMVGTYEPADIRAALIAALDDSGSADLIGLLFDVRASDSLARRPSEAISAMGRFLGSQAHRFGSRLALVASADFAYGLMRMGSVTAEGEGVTTHVFRDEATAREWLRA